MSDVYTASCFKDNNIAKDVLAKDILTENIVLIYSHYNPSYSWLIYDNGYRLIKVLVNETLDNVLFLLMVISSDYLVLTSRGDGTGVTTMRIEVSDNIILGLSGTARFYSNATGTLDESTTWTITSGALRTRYIKCPSGTANLYFSDVTRVTKWGDGSSALLYGWHDTNTVNHASISGDIDIFVNATSITIGGINSLSGDVTGINLEYLTLPNSNTISGDISGMINMRVLSVTGTNTLTGSITNMPLLDTLNVSGLNTLSGNITSLTNLVYINISGSNTITGSITNLINLTTLHLFGNNTVDGDFGLNNVCNGMTAIGVTGTFTTYTTGGVWSNTSGISINPKAGYGYSATEIDNMLIDMAASNPSGETITLKGSSSARTAASDAAVLTLQGRGCTILTNP